MDDLRLPPQNIEAERLVLGALLSPEGLEAFERATEVGLRADDFYRRDHQEIFRRASFFATQGRLPDPIVLLEWLEKPLGAERDDVFAYLLGLVEGCVTVANVDYHAELVRKASARREIIRRSTTAIQSSYEGELSPGEVIAGTLEDLEELREVAAPPKLFEVVSGDEFFNLELDPRDLLVSHEVLSAGEVLFILGAPKAGKSMLGLDLACELAVADGRWIGFDTFGPKKVLICVGEGGRRSFLKRWKKRTSTMSPEERARVQLWFPSPDLLSIEDPEEFRALKNHVVENGYALVILDPLVHFHGLDENSTSDMRIVAGRLIELKEATGAAVLVVHHTRKVASGESKSWRFDEGRGSSVLRGAYDGGMLFGKMSDDDSDPDRKIVFELRNAEHEPEPMLVKLDKLTAHFEVVTRDLGGRPPSVETSWEELVEAIGRIGPATYDEIVGETRVSRRKLERWLPDLLKRNLLVRDRPNRRAPWKWSTPPDEVEREGQFFEEGETS